MLQVSPGDTWTERDVLRAVLLASSNNHADTLARWAFGSVDHYVTEANAWLEQEGFASTRVADATGLSGDNVGTATELTELAARVLADPTLGELLENGDDTPTAAGAKRIPDVIGHLESDGIRAITRSYTDEGGLGFVFTTVLPAAGDAPALRLIGAMLGQPDYETLDPAVLAAVDERHGVCGARRGDRRGHDLRHRRVRLGRPGASSSRRPAERMPRGAPARARHPSTSTGSPPHPTAAPWARSPSTSANARSARR